MDCKEFSNLLDAFMDGALPDAEADRLRAHAAECDACAALLALRQDCRRVDEETEVPDAFLSSWRRMIQEETMVEEKKRKQRNWKSWAGIAAALVFLIGGTMLSRGGMPPRSAALSKNTASGDWADMAAGSSLSTSYRRTADMGSVTNFAYDDYAAPMEAEEASEMEYDAAEVENGGQEKKIIRNASFTIKTTHYEEDLQRIQDLAGEMGGRVEYLSSSGDASSGQTRSASLTLRIPAEALDAFLEGAEGIGNVTAMTQEMEDASDTYYDIQARLETQQEKLKRLQAMIQSARDVSDLIEIESAIADAQYYIDRYTGQLKSFDSRVDFSTVRITVREVKITEMKEVTLGERIVNGLKNSMEEGRYFLEDMVVFLVSVLPWLLGLAALVLAAALIIRNRKKKKENKQP